MCDSFAFCKLKLELLSLTIGIKMWVKFQNVKFYFEEQTFKVCWYSVLWTDWRLFFSTLHYVDFSFSVKLCLD